MKAREYICESVRVQSLWVKSMVQKSVCEKCMGESLWVKSMWLNSLG